MADSKQLQDITARALSGVPAFLKSGLDANKLSVVAGKPTNAYGHAALASIADDDPNKIIIHDVPRFMKATPAQQSGLISHELTHAYMSQAPPSIQAKFAPVNSADPYGMDTNNLNKPITKFSPEQIAKAVETNVTYANDPSISAARKQQVAAQYAPIINQLQALPQATISTDQSQQSDSAINPTMNTQPNAPAAVGFDTRLVRPTKSDKRKWFDTTDVTPDATMGAPTQQASDNATSNDVIPFSAPSTSAPSNASTTSADDVIPFSSSPAPTAAPVQQKQPSMLPSQNPTLPHGLAPGVSDLVESAASKYGIPSNIITGLIHVESSGDPNAHAPTSTAKGLMQLTDGTAHAMGVTNSYDPVQNVEGGTKYLAHMIDLHHGDVREGLAAYYGSRDRAANLNYADKVLKASGTDLSAPSKMPSSASQSASTQEDDVIPFGTSADSNATPAFQSPSNFDTDHPEKGFFRQQANEANSIGAGLGEDVIEPLKLAAKAGEYVDAKLTKHLTNLGSQTLESRQDELAADNTNNPGLRLAGQLSPAIPAAAGGLAAISADLGLGTADSVLLHHATKYIGSLTGKELLRYGGIAAVGKAMGMNAKTLAALEVAASILWHL